MCCLALILIFRVDLRCLQHLPLSSCESFISVDRAEGERNKTSKQIRGTKGECWDTEHTNTLNSIHRSTSQTAWISSSQMTAKRKKNSLTKAEREELLQLAEESEQIWVERIRAISKLAKLRRTTPEELMDSLGIPRSSYE